MAEHSSKVKVGAFSMSGLFNEESDLEQDALKLSGWRLELMVTQMTVRLLVVSWYSKVSFCCLEPVED